MERASSHFYPQCLLNCRYIKVHNVISSLKTLRLFYLYDFIRPEHIFSNKSNPFHYILKNLFSKIFFFHPNSNFCIV